MSFAPRPPIDPMQQEILRRKRMSGGGGAPPILPPGGGPAGRPQMTRPAPPPVRPTLTRPPGPAGPAGPGPTIAAPAAPPIRPPVTRPGQLPNLPGIDHPGYDHPDRNIAAVKARKRAQGAVTPVTAAGLPPRPPAPGAEIVAGQQRAIAAMRGRKGMPTE